MAYRDVGYDFTSYLLAARALHNGSNPYQVAMPFPLSLSALPGLRPDAADVCAVLAGERGLAGRLPRGPGG